MVDDVPNGAGTDAIFFGEGASTIGAIRTEGITPPNVLYLFFTKGRLFACDTVRSVIATLRYRVENVTPSSTDKQMVRSDAPSIVAFMAYIQVFGYRSVLQFICDAMRLLHPTWLAHLHRAVAVTVASSKNPTVAERRNVIGDRAFLIGLRCKSVSQTTLRGARMRMHAEPPIQCATLRGVCRTAGALCCPHYNILAGCA